MRARRREEWEHIGQRLIAGLTRSAERGRGRSVAMEKVGNRTGATMAARDVRLAA